jgi:hypothetical protein
MCSQERTRNDLAKEHVDVAAGAQHAHDAHVVAGASDPRLAKGVADTSEMIRVVIRVRRHDASFGYVNVVRRSASSWVIDAVSVPLVIDVRRCGSS